MKFGWLLMDVGRSSFPISLPASGREEQVVPIAGRYFRGICRAGQLWAGRIWQDCRALEGAATHPLELLNLNEWVICTWTVVFFALLHCSHFLLGFLALTGVRALPTCSSFPWQTRLYLVPASPAVRLPPVPQKPPVSHPCKTPWPPPSSATGRCNHSLEPENICSSSSWS